jgi:hypothetical protein
LSSLYFNLVIVVTCLGVNVELPLEKTGYLALHLVHLAQGEGEGWAKKDASHKKEVMEDAGEREQGVKDMSNG